MIVMTLARNGHRIRSAWRCMPILAHRLHGGRTMSLLSQGVHGVLQAARIGRDIRHAELPKWRLNNLRDSFFPDRTAPSAVACAAGTSSVLDRGHVVRKTGPAFEVGVLSCARRRTARLNFDGASSTGLLDIIDRLALLDVVPHRLGVMEPVHVVALATPSRDFLTITPPKLLRSVFR